MKTYHHVIIFIVCVVFVAAFQYIGLVWSLADFHPGYIPNLPQHLHDQARLGSLMSIPFEWPTSKVFLFFKYNNFAISTFRWIALPLFYGSFVYFLVTVCTRSVLRRFNAAEQGAAANP